MKKEEQDIQQDVLGSRVATRRAGVMPTLGLAATIAALAPSAASAPIGGVKQVSAGQMHTCATTMAGGLTCWGYNTSGQLGDGSYVSPRLRPVDVSGATANMKQVTAASAHTCALSNASAASCWGNYTGTGSINLPIGIDDPQVPTVGFGDVIAAGTNFTCAGTSPTGAGIRCWGFNSAGQLGNGSTNSGSFNPPGSVYQNGTNPLIATHVSAAFMQACAVTGGGTVQCWGNNSFGVLGRNDALPWIANSPIPAPVRNAGNSPIGGVRRVSVGNAHACAVTTNDTVLCWGMGSSGQLGGSAVPTLNNASQNNATEVVGLSNVKDVTVGNAHSCAVLRDGKIKCWGHNAYGQLGRGFMDPSPHLTPQEVLVSAGVALTGATSVSSSNNHTCAVLNGGQLRCWGLNTYGQLGDGTTSTQTYATPVLFSLTVVKAGPGSGTVVDVNQGIHCGTTCEKNFDTPTNTVTLQATADPGSLFLGWGGVNCAGGHASPSCTLTVNDKLTAYAKFYKPAADFNGDGKADILWHNGATGQVFEQQMNGLSLLSGQHIGTQPDLDWKIVAIADIDGDGKADVIWRHATSGQVRGQLMNGHAVLAENDIYLEPQLAWTIVAVADFDGDGKADLLWRNLSTGDVYLLTLDGLTPVSGKVIYNEPNPQWVIQAAADFNGDGRADILWRNGTTGDVFLQFTDKGAVTSGSVIYTEPNANWQIQAASDVNGDGRADILWRNAATGDVYLMLMNGSTVQSGSVIYNEPNPAWKIVASADYNGDGKADILWRNSSTGQVFMMLMNGPLTGASAAVYTEPNPSWAIVRP